MKYETDINLEFENTMTIMLQEIRRESVVLEFGPASGRLTKYLKEQYGCKVYIVELDEEAGRIASQYAEGTVIGDIEQYEWLDKFAHIRFDYVLFADVLEHLYAPEKVLEHVKQLLKPEGYILMSLPHIAHNSIIIDLLDNKFEYKPTGLLDNTHIRFWTYDNIENMLKKLSLKVDIKYATYTQVGFNEFKNTYEDLKRINPMELKSRRMGEIYQFVYKVTMSDTARQIDRIQYYPDYYYNQYFFDGEEIRKEVLIIDDRTITVEAEIPEGVRKFRLNPLNQRCIVSFLNVKVLKNGNWESVECESSNADYVIDHYFIFNHNDAQIYYLVEGGSRIRIEYEIVDAERISNDELINHILKKLDSRRIIIEQKENYIGEQREQMGNLDKEIQNRDKTINQKQEEIDRLLPYYYFIQNHFLFRKCYNLIRKLRRKQNEGK